MATHLQDNQNTVIIYIQLYGIIEWITNLKRVAIGNSYVSSSLTIFIIYTKIYSNLMKLVHNCMSANTTFLSKYL